MITLEGLPLAQNEICLSLRGHFYYIKWLPLRIFWSNYLANLGDWLHLECLGNPGAHGFDFFFFLLLGHRPMQQN